MLDRDTLLRASLANMNYGGQRQHTWARTTLLSILGYEGLGGLLGGTLLITAPDGRYMDMPVDILHGTFPNFFIPGIILTALGLISTYAFFVVLKRRLHDWIWAHTALWGYTIWFMVEITIVGLHWLHAMWGLPVLLGLIAALPLIPLKELSPRGMKLLLSCGALSALVYLLANVIVPAQWPSYDPASQTISELSAIGAPTRLLWTVMCLPYTLLVIAFGFGVLAAGENERSVRRCGKLVILYGATGILWTLAPMHLRETLAAGGGTWSDTMHLTLGGITWLMYVLIMIFASLAFGKSFRLFSALTFAVFMIFGILMSVDAPSVSVGGPTPYLGIWERINLGVVLLWMCVLAAQVYRAKFSAHSVLTERRLDITRFA